jgi:arylsulfatase A-like enzyme
MWENRNKFQQLFQLSFGKRPAEELYAVKNDPYNLTNLAADPKHSAARNRLSQQLDRYLVKTEDPRATGRGELLDAVMKAFPVLGSNQTGR